MTKTGRASGSQAEEKLIYAIGRVAVSASRMEMIAASVYADLLGGGKTAEVVAFGQNWATVSQSCSAILDQLPLDQSVARLKTAFQRVNEAYTQRTRIVHGFWIAAVGAGEERFSVRIKRHGDRDVSSWTVAQVLAVAQELAEAGTELMRVSGVVPTLSPAPGSQRG